MTLSPTSTSFPDLTNHIFLPFGVGKATLSSEGKDLKKVDADWTQPSMERIAMENE